MDSGIQASWFLYFQAFCKVALVIQSALKMLSEANAGCLNAGADK